MTHRITSMYPKNWQEARQFFNKMDLKSKMMFEQPKLQSKIKQELIIEILQFQEESKVKIKDSQENLNSARQQKDFIKTIKFSNDLYFYQKNLKSAKDWQRIKLTRS